MSRFEVSNVKQLANLNASLAERTKLLSDFPIQTPETDDTARIQRAMDWCHTNSKTLWIPAGHYTISNTLLPNNISVIGEGEGITTIEFVGTSSVDIISFADTWVNYLVWKDLTIKNSGSGVNGLTIGKCGNSKFENILLTGMTGTGLVINPECYQNKFSGITISNVGQDGLYLKGFTNNGINDGSDYTYRCNSNQFDKIYISVFGRYGIYSNQASGNLFNNPDIEVQTGTGTIAFYFYNSKNNQVNTPWTEMNGKGQCVKIDGLATAYTSDNKFIGGQLVPHGSTDTLSQTAVIVGASARNMFIGIGLVRAFVGYSFGSNSQGNVLENPAYLTVTTAVQDSGSGNINDVISLLGKGGIVDSGSNSNGRYAKFADGTLVNWNYGMSLTYQATTTLAAGWTFPLAFVDTNYSVAPGIGAPPSGKRSVSFPTYSKTSNSVVTLQLLNDSATTYASGDTATASPIAIGRWK